MGFTDAVTTVFSNYANFNGRAARPEFWWWALFVSIVYVVFAVLAAVIGREVYALLALFVLAVILPNLAVTARRLHDTDRSGWWQLIALVPIIGPIVLLIFEILPGTPGANRFG